MSYCTVNDVRNLTGIETDDINDNDINTLINYAIAEMNAEINTKVIREKVRYIDSTRENKIDGSNTTFYVQWWKNHYIGDLDNDGDVDSDDVIFYLVDSDGTETTATVSSVDVSTGKITLSSAPDSDNNCYITYAKAPLDENTPHFLIKKACVELTAALCYMRIDKNQITRVKLGKWTIFKQPDIFKDYYNRYRDTIYLIQNKIATMAKASRELANVLE